MGPFLVVKVNPLSEALPKLGATVKGLWASQSFKLLEPLFIGKMKRLKTGLDRLTYEPSCFANVADDAMYLTKKGGMNDYRLSPS